MLTIGGLFWEKSAVAENLGHGLLHASDVKSFADFSLINFWLILSNRQPKDVAENGKLVKVDLVNCPVSLFEIRQVVKAKCLLWAYFY